MWIDDLARLIGYTVLVCAIIWLLVKWTEARNKAQAEFADKKWLEKLRLENPERYNQEVWWRNNHERFLAGLEVDPEYIRQMKATAKSAREQGPM